MKQTVSAKQAFLDEILKDGEAYAGILLGKKGEPDHHLILLPGQATKVNWADAKKFAADAGGELPTRREQSLLFANLKEEFEEHYYWSGEQHASNSGFAWLQYFYDGYQYDAHNNGNNRARAVRRLKLYEV